MEESFNKPKEWSGLLNGDDCKIQIKQKYGYWLEVDITYYIFHPVFDVRIDQVIAVLDKDMIIFQTYGVMCIGYISDKDISGYSYYNDEKKEFYFKPSVSYENDFSVYTNDTSSDELYDFEQIN